MSNQIHNVNSGGNGNYERHDISVSTVVYFLISLAIAMAIVGFIAQGVYKYFESHFEAQQTPVSPLVTAAPSDTRRIPPQYGNDYEKYLREGFPAPQLEVNERTELNDIRLREANTLNTYDYVDKNAGTVRIPIERAMDLLAQRGLPVRSQGAAMQPQPEKKKGSKQ